MHVGENEEMININNSMVKKLLYNPYKLVS